MSDEAKRAIDALFVVLEEERVAVRTLDGAAVERAAQAKEAFAATISSLDHAGLAPHAKELRLLASQLRRNGILLAHARACLREVTSIGRETSSVRVRARV